jgi:recombination protein RecA
MAKDKSSVVVEKDTSSVKSDKQKKLDLLLNSINKEHGKGTVSRLGDNVIEKITAYSTGSLVIDKALGVGGVPKGRIIEIYGPESSGKTTLTLQIIASVQKKGGIAAFIDVEHALDPVYAKALGCNIEELIVSQPDHAEQALQLVDEFASSECVDLIIVDSVAALVPKVELDGDMEDQQMGLQARLMSKACRKLTAVASRNGTTIIFINQLRQKIGNVSYGSNEVTTGGNALKFFASVRIDIRKVQAIKKGDEIIGNEIKVKIVKNKVAPPFRVAETEIYFGEGISMVGEVLSLGIKYDIVDKSGGWHSYGERKLGNGRENVLKLLREDKELFDELRSKVLEKMEVEGLSIGSPDTSDE